MHVTEIASSASVSSEEMRMSFQAIVKQRAADRKNTNGLIVL